jgi:hypothetical protein
MVAFVQQGLGVTFYFRVSATTIIGTSNHSSIMSKSLVATPGVCSNLHLSIAGPLALSVAWGPPADFGIGVGVPNPLLQYVVTLQLEASTATYTLYADASASQLVVADFRGSPLLRGTGYYATVQAQNDVGLGPLFLPQQYLLAVGLSTAPAGVALCRFDAVAGCGPTAFASVAGSLALRYLPSPTLCLCYCN